MSPPFSAVAQYKKKHSKIIKSSVIGSKFVQFLPSKTKLLLTRNRLTQDYTLKITAKTSYILCPITFRGCECEMSIPINLPMSLYKPKNFATDYLHSMKPIWLFLCVFFFLFALLSNTSFK